MTQEDVSIRATKSEDLDALKKVLDTLELFPSECLDEMIADYLNNPDTKDIWLTATVDNQPVALAYCAPEKFTEGTFNLLAIGVHIDHQGSGIGKQIMSYLEILLRDKGNRILIVETSSAEQYERTRKFYLKQQYTKEAVLRDFWSEGEDKVVFWKKF